LADRLRELSNMPLEKCLMRVAYAIADGDITVHTVGDGECLFDIHGELLDMVGEQKASALH